MSCRGLELVRAASTMDPEDPELAGMEAELKVGSHSQVEFSRFASFSGV